METISREKYEEVKAFVNSYLNERLPQSKPMIKFLEYLESKIYEYDRDFGDNKICECSHVYYRHFDTYEFMFPIGCKYCGCRTFKEKR